MDRSRSNNHRLPDLFTSRQWTMLAGYLDLTPRQVQVARWVCRGYAAARIAEDLGVTPNTVRMHVQALFKKLDIHDRIGVPVRLILADRKMARDGIG